jgi:hypothetical protein
MDNLDKLAFRDRRVTRANLAWVVYRVNVDETEPLAFQEQKETPDMECLVCLVFLDKRDKLACRDLQVFQVQRVKLVHRHLKMHFFLARQARKVILDHQAFLVKRDYLDLMASAVPLAYPAFLA